MEEKDFQRFEQIISKAVKAEVGQAVKGEIEKIDAKLNQLRKDVNEDFQHHVGILSEDFQHKLQLVAEGHQMLSGKMDRINAGIAEKLDAVTADLSAHRADTEGHKRGYLIKEP